MLKCQRLRDSNVCMASIYARFIFSIWYLFAASRRAAEIAPVDREPAAKALIGLEFIHPKANADVEHLVEVLEVQEGVAVRIGLHCRQRA